MRLQIARREAHAARDAARAGLAAAVAELARRPRRRAQAAAEAQVARARLVARLERVLGLAEFSRYIDFNQDGSITIVDDPTFRAEPAYLFPGAFRGATLNVHTFDRPRFAPFKKSTCYGAVAGRARLVEMATHSRESHLAVDTYMDVDEIKRNGSWGSNPATVITDEYIEWTAREILAYASFLDAPSIDFKPYGEIASDNLDRLVAAITRIQNEEM